MPYTREQLLQIQSSARVFQARADDAFAPWGMRAPEPSVLAKIPDHYRRQTADQGQGPTAGGSMSYRGVTIKRYCLLMHWSHTRI